jgi:hypothetical protein
MNKKFPCLMATLFCLAAISAFGDETNLLARWGVPTNALVAAADPINQSVNSEDLADALGIRHWDFLVQVPYDGMLPVSFHWVENGKDRELGHTSLVIDRLDQQTGKFIPPPHQDRILFVVCPVENSTEDPWQDSAKLRIFVKDYDRGDSGFLLIENPFKNKNEGYSIDSAPMAVHDHKIPPGSVENALGTEFDLMTTASNKLATQSAFRISFK